MIKHNNIALILASKYGHNEAIKSFFIDHGMNENAKYKFNKTVLILASE